ncbi:hypothetical protein TWF569_009066 [Orbilia oligospora]|nr:hypothetical protein TWF706_005183 [Orbilia oligospora]KAF3137979.1 hypothetical protein TWF569_009066 [Orbilia oligospora]KAF3153193.1 hypothetical protein TWF594_000227 [Orbilia oligospora]
MKRRREEMKNVFWSFDSILKLRSNGFLCDHVRCVILFVCVCVCKVCHKNAQKQDPTSSYPSLITNFCLSGIYNMSSLPPCSNSKKIPQNIIKKNGKKKKGVKTKE